MADENNGLPKKFSEDGVHPNKEGYVLMAPLVESAISEALKIPSIKVGIEGQ
jgi:lysophospholipase L1-like esterase